MSERGNKSNSEGRQGERKVGMWEEEEGGKCRGRRGKDKRREGEGSK